MSMATESLAKSVLAGVVKTADLVSGSVMKSKPGKKFFSILPGEVALVSLDAFGMSFPHFVHGELVQRMTIKRMLQKKYFFVICCEFLLNLRTFLISNTKFLCCTA
jgi:hypothetical protein